MALFGFGKEKELTYKVNLDTQSMQQQMQQMQFQQQQQSLTIPSNLQMSNNYLDAQALQNFALAQQAQYMDTMGYSQLSLKERLGVQLTNKVTKSIAAIGGGLSTGLMIAEMGMPAAVGTTAYAAELATGKEILPSTIIGAKTGLIIEGISTGIAEGSIYKTRLNLASDNNLIGQPLTSEFKNSLASYLSNVGNYYRIGTHDMGNILTSAIDNNLIDPQDLEKTKEDIYKLTRSLKASTKILYESMDMIGTTIKDFQKYSIFNSKPEQMLETATFIKSVANLTGHSAEQILSTTEAISNALVAGTTITPGEVASSVLKGELSTYTAANRLEGKDVVAIENSGGINQLQGRALAQAHNFMLNNRDNFAYIMGAYAHQTGKAETLSAGIHEANRDIKNAYSTGDLNTYTRDTMTELLSNTEALASIVDNEVARTYGKLIRQGKMKYKGAVAQVLQNTFGMDNATAEAYAPIIMRNNTYYTEFEESWANAIQTNEQLNAFTTQEESSLFFDMGRSLGNFLSDMFVDRVGSVKPFLEAVATKVQLPSLSKEDKEQISSVFKITEETYNRLSQAQLNQYKKLYTLLKSNDPTEVEEGLHGLSNFFSENSIDVEAPPEASQSVEDIVNSVNISSDIVRDINAGLEGRINLTSKQAEILKDVLKSWAKKYFYYNQNLTRAASAQTVGLKYEKKVEILREILVGIGAFDEEVIDSIIEKVSSKKLMFETTLSERTFKGRDGAVSSVNERTIVSQTEELIDSMDSSSKLTDNILRLLFGDTFIDERQAKDETTISSRESLLPILKKLGVTSDQIEHYKKTGEITFNTEQRDMYNKLVKEATEDVNATIDVDGTTINLRNLGLSEGRLTQRKIDISLIDRVTQHFTKLSDIEELTIIDYATKIGKRDTENPEKLTEALKMLSELNQATGDKEKYRIITKLSSMFKNLADSEIRALVKGGYLTNDQINDIISAADMFETGEISYEDLNKKRNMNNTVISILRKMDPKTLIKLGEEEITVEDILRREKISFEEMNSIITSINDAFPGMIQKKVGASIGETLQVGEEETSTEKDKTPKESGSEEEFKEAIAKSNSQFEVLGKTLEEINTDFPKFLDYIRSV